MLKTIRNRTDWSDKSGVEQGFTLIELLVVIAILGILAVVGILSFGGLTDSAHHAVNGTELVQVQTAVDAYRALNAGLVPANTAALVPGQLNTAPVCLYTIAATGVVTKDAVQTNVSCNP